MAANGVRPFRDRGTQRRRRRKSRRADQRLELASVCAEERRELGAIQSRRIATTRLAAAGRERRKPSPEYGFGRHQRRLSGSQSKRVVKLRAAAGVVDGLEELSRLG